MNLLIFSSFLFLFFPIKYLLAEDGCYDLHPTNMSIIGMKIAFIKIKTFSEAAVFPVRISLYIANLSIKKENFTAYNIISIIRNELKIHVNYVCFIG